MLVPEGVDKTIKPLFFKKLPLQADCQLNSKEESY